uniref:SANT domain-containing protein n=1 Tax=Salarias fasciatus TaxID=181472 RepID=A0A672HGY8_SALFA
IVQKPAQSAQKLRHQEYAAKKCPLQNKVPTSREIEELLGPKRRANGPYTTIRVGSRFQAELPAFQPPSPPALETQTEREELLWTPEDLPMVPSAAAGATAASVSSTASAFDMLRGPAAALQLLEEHSYTKPVEQYWTEEEQKLFCKGLKTHGKNFFLIRKEFLPGKTTGELVKFYYDWKKTPQAHTVRAHLKKQQQTQV